jgi:hypothetical protein
MATQTNPRKTTQNSKRDDAQAGRASARNGQGMAANMETGAADETYGLVSVLYHSLQGAQTYAQYAADAERAGEQDLVEFFQDCQGQEKERASRAKRLLAIQLGDFEDEEEEDDDDDDEET